MLLKGVVLSAMATWIAASQPQARPPSAPAATTAETPVSELVVINQAAITYFSWFQRIPAYLEQLGSGRGKVANVNGADLIRSGLASGSRNGYRYPYHGEGRMDCASRSAV